MDFRFRTAANTIIVVVLTVVGGFFAFVNGWYGLMGVHNSFKQHLAWTEAAMVYWMLLLIGIFSSCVVLSAWLLVLMPRRRSGKLPR